jgi:hypothetical protein
MLFDDPGAVALDAEAPLVPSEADELPKVTGWLCANADMANTVDNANSAPIIFLTASANVLCFMFHLCITSF